MQLAGVVIEAARAAADEDAEEIGRADDRAGRCGLSKSAAKDCFRDKV